MKYSELSSVEMNGRPGAPDTPIEILLSVGADGETYGSRGGRKTASNYFFWFWGAVFPVSGCTKYPDHEWDRYTINGETRQNASANRFPRKENK